MGIITNTVATAAGAQTSKTAVLASAVRTTGAQTPANVDGYNGAQLVEVLTVGTVAAQAAAFFFEGSFDGTNWYSMVYQRADAQVTLTRVVGNTTLTPGNGPLRAVFELLDLYPLIRLNIASNTLGTGLTANLYTVPM